MLRSPYLIPAALLSVGIVVYTLVSEQYGGYVMGIGIIGALYIWSNRRNRKR